MIINTEYQEFKRQYDDITTQISNLHEEQGKLLELMRESCTHVNRTPVYPNSYLVGVGAEDDTIKYKCKDCYQYFDNKS